MRKSIVFTCALLMACQSSRPSESRRAPIATRSSTLDDNRLSEILDSVRKADDLPGLAAVIVRSDSIVAVGAVGRRHMSRPDSIQATDEFHLGSNGKAMTATMIGVLVEKGVLSWDATPAMLFVADSETFDPSLRRATLTQILGHAGGLDAFEELEEMDKLGHFAGTPPVQRRAFTVALLRRKAAYPPGTRHLYSNAGYAVAGAMAEAATGKSWEDLMRELVFAPLHMQPGFGWPAHDDPNQPWGHGKKLFRRGAHDPKDDHQVGPILAPAGDMHASMRDYGRFLQAHLRGLRGRDDLLRSRTIAMLHTAVAPDSQTHYALGWGIQQIDGVESHVHAGGAGTFYAVVAIQPGRDLAIAVVSNAGDDPAGASVRRVFKALLALGN